MPGAVRRMVLCAVLAVSVLLAQLVVPASSALAQSAPHLASLVIDMWPEFDRPSTALVIYRGEFAPDAPLPTQVKIRIPASAGEPSALAAPRPGSETASVNQWTDLIVTKQMTTTLSGDWIEVAFAPPSRLFNLEFYDKLNTVTFDRRYTLTWPGDLTADAVTLNVREPFGATNFQATPALPPGATDEEGLISHQLNIGALAAGQSLVVSLSYHREDKRTSVEALQLVTPVPTRQPAASPVAATSTPWLFIAALVVGLALIAGGIAWYVRSQRAETFRPYEPPQYRHVKGRRAVRTSRAPRSRPRPAATYMAESGEEPIVYCTQCGKPLRSDDVFCSRCGARVKGK